VNKLSVPAGEVVTVCAEHRPPPTGLLHWWTTDPYRQDHSFARV